MRFSPAICLVLIALSLGIPVASSGGSAAGRADRIAPLTAPTAEARVASANGLALLASLEASLRLGKDGSVGERLARWLAGADADAIAALALRSASPHTVQSIPCTAPCPCDIRPYDATAPPASLLHR